MTDTSYLCCTNPACKWRENHEDLAPDIASEERAGFCCPWCGGGVVWKDL
jgi:ssDNA-binding Zn-finger/Zn-ribbon topoisomerase 1